ncbi:MAG TPA: ABC transporter permease [Vicinamibacterales bacterium]|jgi:ABC-2 type transport system permease protein|nr:ABC transporter permease [Vicinamibacterales bacterium]
MQRLRFLVWKEFLELRQNPRLFGIVVLAPIIQLTMLGYAATTDVRDVPVVVADGDRSPASRELAARFEASRNFTVIDTVSTVAEIDHYMERGRAWLALAIPAGYGAEVRARRPVTVQVVADGSDANSTTVALGYATSLIGGYAQELVASAGDDRLLAGGIDAQIRVWFNPQLESRHFMIPGVLALVLLVVTANLASMAIVREKELGTLEQLNVTPLRRWELVVGKLLPYGLIGLVDVLLVVAVAVFWFEVPLRGSFPLLYAMSVLYLLSTLGLGLFISTISDTQQQAMMTATFFFLMPMIYLSGFIFPIENMPAVIQPFTYLIPLRYYLVMVRGIFLKGIGLELLWPQAAALAAWGLAMIALAVARSQKRAG